MLSCTGSLLADKKPVKVGLADITAARQQRVTRAADKEGVKATLKYEKVADMLTPRMAHQAFPSGNGLVVVGGRTTGFNLTKTAELYQDGTWTSLSIANNHDGAFAVKLSDGRYMVGGGFSSAKGVGQSRVTDIYNPQTRTFTAGPQLTSARAQGKAISIGSKVYVSGNWYASDPTLDYYDGSAFKAVGEMDGRSNPYMMTDRNGELYVLSAYDTQGQSFGFHTYNDGSIGLRANMYHPTTGETQYFGFPFSSQVCPVALPDDAKSTDYHITYNGNNSYLMLTKTPNGNRPFRACRHPDRLPIASPREPLNGKRTLMLLRNQCLPQIVGRHWCFYDNRLLGNGMDELHTAGEQRDTAIRVGARSTVLQVATNRHTGFGQLAAYLVVTASEQLHLQ